MNTRVIEIAKEWQATTSLETISGGCAELQTHCTQNGLTDDECLTVKIMIVGFCMRAEPALANRLLIEYAHSASPFNRYLIFRKIDLADPAAVALCRKYIAVPAHRSVISSRFRQFQIFCDEAHAYDITALERHLAATELPSSSGEALDCAHRRSLLHLFGTINTDEFKITRKCIAHLSKYDVTEYISALTENGFRNLKELNGTRLYNSVVRMATPFHPSETVRTECLLRTPSIDGVLEFLRYNQRIEDITNQTRLIGHFTHVLGNALGTGESQAVHTVVRGFVDSCVVDMCASPTLCRRFLGAQLLRVCLDGLQCARDYEQLVDQLVYDKSHEVRQAVAPLCPAMDAAYTFPLARLLSHHYYSVYGATSYLSRTDPAALFGLFKGLLHRCITTGIWGVLAQGEDIDALVCATDAVDAAWIRAHAEKLVECSIFGFIHCLTVAGHRTDEFGEFIDAFYDAALASQSTIAQRVLKECCFFYDKTGNIARLMATLLHCDQLGIISAVKSYLLPRSISAEAFLPAGLECVARNKRNTRKSGGLCVYFQLLAKDQHGYRTALPQLLGLLYESGTSNFNADEATTFHCLNVLKIWVESFLFDDIIFYIETVFRCLRHASFNMKNCGLSIFSAVVRKILLCYRTVDILFTVHEPVRDLLVQFWGDAIRDGDHRTIYFIIFLFSRSESLRLQEIALLRRCIAFGGFIQLKAQKLLDKSEALPATTPPAPEPAIKFCSSVPECRRLFALYRLLSCDEPAKALAARRYLQLHYGVGDFSNEYTMHRLVALAVEKGHGAHFAHQFSLAQKEEYQPVNEIFDEETDCHRDDNAFGNMLLSLYAK
ncbi:hypothetical protein PAPHI01_1762 [Pancytospora philotis]|nr:hypothetical protein PAPHI01_1762 [Pancytospora philotis]